MTHNTSPTTPSRRLSAVWLIPLAALLLGLWLAYSYWSSRGPVVTLIMPTAEGIQAGKTPVRTRNVQVGVVQGIRLSDDFSHTLLTVQMDNAASDMLREDSRFWVVKPRIGREGISGLGTVLSGAYLELLPGQNGEFTTTFEVADTPPITRGHAAGSMITLHSAPGHNLSPGDPVNYLHLTVGRVLESRFDLDQQQHHHRIFIESPYDQLLDSHSRFWVVSGFNLQLAADGVTINMPSFETLLGGGIAFGTPQENRHGHHQSGEPMDTTKPQRLYGNEQEARRSLYDQTLEYVLMFDANVRGLHAGAPVEYQGLRLGTVEQVAWGLFDDGPQGLGTTSIPVRIKLEPQRLSPQLIALEEWSAHLQELFEQGLHATLKPANLLTGTLYVDLEIAPSAEPWSGPSHYRELPVIPTAPSGLAQIESQVRAMLDNLNQLPLADIIHRLDRNLEVSEGTLSAITTTVDQLSALVADPAIRALPAQLTETLQSVQQALESLHIEHLESSLDNLDRTLRDTQPLLNTLRESPGALIFPPKQTADPQPGAAR